MDDVFYSTSEAAEYLRRSPLTLQNWRSQGKGPDYYKAGGRALYKASDLTAWLEEEKVKL